MPAIDYPLRVRYNAGNFQDLIEMTAAEFTANYAYRMAKGWVAQVASAQPSGEILVQAGSPPAGGTSIGSFTNTWRTEPANSPNNANATGATASNTYYFKQVEDTPSSTISPSPLYWDGSVLRETKINAGVSNWNLGVAQTTLMSKIMDETIPGKYRLQQSTPTGGTWVSRATILDNTDASTGDVPITYTLWQKTEVASPPADGNRPLKFSTGAIREMSNAEQEGNYNIIENAFRATGVMRYRLQNANPSGTLGGTWIACGDTFQDRINEYTLVGSYFNVTTTIVNAGSGTVTLWGQSA